MKKARFLQSWSSISLLRIIAMIDIVFASAFLYYDWSVTMTGNLPYVWFYKWSDHTVIQTIELTYNIYANLWTVDPNATYGIKNTASIPKTIFMWADSCNATTWFLNYTVQILNTTGAAKATWTTISFASVGESTAVNWTHPAGQVWTIKVLFKGSSSVVVAAVAKVKMKLKTSE